MIFAGVALGAPLVEVVFPADGLNVGVELVGAHECGDFIGVDGIGLSAAGDFAFAAEDGDDSGVAGFVYVDAIGPGTEDGEGEIGRVDFEGFVLLEALDADADGAFGDLDLGDAVVEIEEGETRGAAETDRGGADVEFGTGAVVGPQSCRRWSSAD